jgi:hypothetical protein
MKLRRCVWLTAIVLLVVMTVSACNKKVPPPPPPPPEPPAAPAPPPPPPPPAPAPAPAPPPGTAARCQKTSCSRKDARTAERRDAAGRRHVRLRHGGCRENQRGVLQKNADWMRRWTTTRVTIEGHADAAEAPMSNLALGERRGNAVKGYW